MGHGVGRGICQRPPVVGTFFIHSYCDLQKLCRYRQRLHSAARTPRICRERAKGNQKCAALERLTKPKSDQSNSKSGQGQVDITPTFISNMQTLVSMEPGKGALDDPTVFFKMSGTFHTSFGNSVFYVSHHTRLSAKWGIISFICVEFLRMASRFPMQISQGWQMIKRIL